MYPHPVLGLDPFLVVLVVISVFGTLQFFYLLRDSGYSIRELLLLQLSILISTLIGAKLFSLYVRGWELFPSLKHEIAAGWRYPGAVLGLFILMPLLKRLLAPRVSLLRCGDASAVAAAFALGVFRVSCIMNGCCTGGVGHEPYCWTYERGSAVWFTHLKEGLVAPGSEHSLPVVPLHLYFMLASFAVGAFLLWYRKRKHFDGELLLWFMLLHEGAKAALESFRVPHIAALQYTSLGVAIAAAVALVACSYLSRRTPGSDAAGVAAR
jgi:phosphatidylglycerol:prolipoprotein diacylglycerol transferase